MLKLVVANWKLHPITKTRALALFDAIVRKIPSGSSVETVVCPPYPFLDTLATRSRRGKKISVGAQDVFWAESGSYTGAVSAGMVKKLGGKYAIIGHSERRTHVGETNAEIAKKMKFAVRSGLLPILCIGEELRDRDGVFFKFIRKELLDGLKLLTRKEILKVIIAYEPLWAIGTGKSATPEDAYEMNLFLKRVLLQHFTRKISASVRILYGGSVNAENSIEFKERSEIDGFLVGGASLQPQEFSNIVRNLYASRR